MADPTKAWNLVFTKGSKKAQDNLKKVHGKNPQFQTFLKSHGMEGGERSVKQASTSLKKSTETKVAAQKIADMRFKKALQASSERVKEMGRRRREGGEGLGGGLETARDVVAHVKKYGSIKAGRLGEGFDPKPAEIAAELVKKHGKGSVTSKHLDAYEVERDSRTGLDREEIMKHVKKLSEETVNEVSKAEAEKVLGGAVKEKPKMGPGKQPAGYRYVRGLARRAMKAGLKKEEVEVTETPEVIVEQDDSMEKKEMAQTQLHFIKYAAEEILAFIDMGGEVEEWYQNKLSKVQSEVESLHSYVEGEKRRTGMVKEEEQIDEKAPPGAKFERMVKHIKAGYAKGGLTKQEKGIAYATAWKAYKKNEEVEQVDEGVTHWEYTGTVNGKDYSLTIPRGADLMDHLSHKKIMKQNPHLEPHEAKAVAETSGEDEEHVEVEHEGKKYTHHVTNDQEPRMVYSEEVEHVTEKYMGFKAVMAAAKKGGARDPAAVAAAIGRKKYGKEKFQAMAAAGKKANEETEVVTEAEGKVAVSPKEKTLAAMHGDKTKITYGDVIKARLQSAKEKALKGKE